MKNNKTNTLDKLKNEEQKKPFICAQNLAICLNTSFNALEDVIAVDELDEDLSKKIIVAKNTVNTSEVGSYLVVYKVTNSLGFTQTREITVTVINCPSRCEELVKIVKCIAKLQSRFAKILNEQGELLQFTINTGTTLQILEVHKKVNCIISLITELEKSLLNILKNVLLIFKENCL